MIYQSFNFIDTYSNASGNKRDSIVLGELGKVIRENPEAVKSALIDADIILPKEINRKGLVRAIMSNKRNIRMVKNLSPLIVASASFDGGYDFTGEEDDFENFDPEKKQELFKGIGTFFKNRKERKSQGTVEGEDKGKFFKRIGAFFSKNKEQIASVGSSLYDSLQERKAQDTMRNNINNRYATTDEDTTKKEGFFQKNKTAVIVVGVIGAVVLGYFIIKKRK
jgi:hypothetical protein